MDDYCSSLSNNIDFIYANWGYGALSFKDSKETNVANTPIQVLNFLNHDV